MADYVIVGGGCCGCVVASRLKQYVPAASIVILETGPDKHEDPLITEPMGTFQLHGSEYEYNYKTVPQKHYDGREVFQAGGKVLSGSTSVNFATWTRGGRDDYNVWGDMVGDQRWSYDGLLPFFRKTETHWDSEGDKQQHGFNGPIHSTCSAREYPLKTAIRDAMLKATGLPMIPDGNNGDFVGVAAYTENWHPRGKRQPAGFAYGLEGVEVVTNATVRRVVMEGNVARAAELVDGRVFEARKEIIICCGAIRTPQMLMLSGIGPRAELDKFGIPQAIESPQVGLNYNDHSSVCLFFKLKDIDKGYAAGSSLWNHPSYLLGIPADTIAILPASHDKLKAAMIADGHTNITDDDVHLKRTRGHIELLPIYAPTEAPLTDLGIPFDGSCITIPALNLLPTSRGSIRLKTTDPKDDPLIDPNYYATQADRVILREAIRYAYKIAEHCPDILGAEIPPPGFSPLDSTSADEEYDARVRRMGSTWFHYCGSASMGKVVDTNCRVIGAERLRVVDASIIPTPIAAHYQVVSYALAEQGAKIISESWGSQ